MKTTYRSGKCFLCHRRAEVPRMVDGTREMLCQPCATRYPKVPVEMTNAAKKAGAMKKRPKKVAVDVNARIEALGKLRDAGCVCKSPVMEGDKCKRCGVKGL